MSFAFRARTVRRRPSLTPMIDVVFLLLVFFLVAARFAPEGAIPLSRPGASAPWEGAPRLVEVSPEGLALNGRPMAPPELVEALARLMPAPGAPVVLRPAGGATLQDLVAAMELLRGSGFGTLLLAGGR